MRLLNPTSQSGCAYRGTLLDSISHDLRTPLSVIAGASSALVERGATLDEGSRLSLARGIKVKSRQMSDLVSNVLDVMRFESGQVVLRRDWKTVDDLAGSTLSNLHEKLNGRTVELRFPEDLPPVYVDATLIVQVFSNLLDNVAKYTPPTTHYSAHEITDSKLRLRWTSPCLLRLQLIPQ